MGRLNACLQLIQNGKIKDIFDFRVFGYAWPTLENETVTPWLLGGYESLG